MPNDVFIAINSNALHAKSKVYIGRALTRKASGNLDEYQLWASLALELLGKAALSHKHPCLIVDPTDWQSMFVAAGINSTTDVKTITAHTLFERLKHLVPKFDSTIQKFCKAISQRRNAELHSADLPFHCMKLDAWEASYWHACDTILDHMESSLEQWLDATDAKAPRQLLDEATKALIAAVKLRIETSKKKFEAQKKANRDRLISDAELREPWHQASLFKSSYDKIWKEACPACKCWAFMAGEKIGEDINEDTDGDAIWEVVDREFFGEEFRCPTCDLALIGSGEIAAASMNLYHQDQQEREMEYEPDYGND